MLSIKQLTVDLEKIKKEYWKTSYMVSYPHLISYFEGKNPLTDADFIRGMHMVYGWMPTMLEIHIDCPDTVKKAYILKHAVALINKAKDESHLEKEDIENLKKVINNSVVGASKLLHFISPEKFPIWDTRVYSYIFKERAYGYRVNNSGKYLEYLSLVKDIIEQDGFDQIHDTVNKKIGYGVTPVRAAELIMFQNGKSD